MLFTIPSTDLVNGLSTVTRAIAARPSKQILEGVLIDAHENEVQLTATDGNLTIQSIFAANVKEEGSVVLPGRLFTEIVRKLPNGEAEIKVGDNMQAKVKCLSSRFNLSGMNAVDFPDVPVMEHSMEISLKQSDLKNMITRVAFAVATDETRPVLTGTLLEVTPDELKFVALDGYRLSLQRLHQSFETDGKTLKAIIPGKVISELGKVLSDDESLCTVQMEAGKVRFVFGQTILTSTVLAGEYIDYEKILPISFKTEAHANRSEFESAIDRASLIAREGKTNLIRIRLDSDEMTVSSKSEIGDVEVKLPVEMQGDTIEIAFNAKYISDIIHNVVDDEIYMSFNSNVSPCVVLPKEGDSYYYLLLPVRYFQ